jgi:hypothetical protein
MLGEALCGSTGADGGSSNAYQTGPCKIINPFRHWVIQAQYFYGVLNQSGVPDPSGVSWTGHAVTGDTVPVFPGEQVRTNFTMLANGTWLLQLGVVGDTPAARGNTLSVVQVDHPYMNPALDWLHPDFNHTLVGACNEVYNLNPRSTDVPRPLHINVTVSAVRGTGMGEEKKIDWFAPWSVNEGLPQCDSGLSNISLVNTISEDGRTQTVIFTAI